MNSPITQFVDDQSPFFKVKTGLFDTVVIEMNANTSLPTLVQVDQQPSSTVVANITSDELAMFRVFLLSAFWGLFRLILTTKISRFAWTAFSRCEKYARAQLYAMEIYQVFVPKVLHRAIVLIHQGLMPLQKCFFYMQIASYVYHMCVNIVGITPIVLIISDVQDCSYLAEPVRAILIAAQYFAEFLSYLQSFSWIGYSSRFVWNYYSVGTTLNFNVLYVWSNVVFFTYLFVAVRNNYRQFLTMTIKDQLLTPVRWTQAVRANVDDAYPEPVIAVSTPIQQQFVKVTPTLTPIELENMTSPEHNQFGITECPICFDGFTAENAAVRLTCGHLYHSECVTQYFATQDENPFRILARVSADPSGMLVHLHNTCCFCKAPAH